MNYIESEFLDYDKSLKMKFLGFNEPCLGWYKDSKNLLIYFLFNVNDIEDFMILAPQYKQCFDWFKIKYGIISYFEFFKNMWCFVIISNNQEQFISEYYSDIKTAENECFNQIYNMITSEQ